MAETTREVAATGRRAPGHESARLDGRRVAILAIVVAGLIAIALLVVLALVAALPGQPPPQSARLRPAPGAPVLRAAPGAELRAFKAEKDALLHAYAWVDRDAGVVRIPIDRAMALLAARGDKAPAAQSTGAQGGESKRAVP